MNTTVTVVFPDQNAAFAAATKLMRSGLGLSEVRVVDADSPDRHDFIQRRSADSKRGMILGTACGAVGGLVIGMMLAGVFGLLPAVVIAGILAAGMGAVLGLGVGKTTASQIEEELERQVDAGTVLVGVATDDAHLQGVLDLLDEEHGTIIVSTEASFRVGGSDLPNRSTSSTPTGT